jgi:hypothetical protein
MRGTHFGTQKVKRQDNGPLALGSALIFSRFFGSVSASSGTIEWHLNGTSGQLEAEILESMCTVLSCRSQAFQLHNAVFTGGETQGLALRGGPGTCEARRSNRQP